MNYFKYIAIIWYICISTHYIQAQQKHFSGGYLYSMYICNNKTLNSWGDNYYNQLGRNEAMCNNSTPCTVPFITNVKSIDASLGGHCLALTTSEKVLAWGHNFYGELGSNAPCPTICKRAYADTVWGGETGTQYLENVKAIAAGLSQSYALLNDGRVVAWGSNNFGQLGNGTTTDQLTPIFVKKNASEQLSNIVMISAGANHAYALTQDGYVYAWGDNQYNQLGCGNSDMQMYPQFVVDKNNNKISGIISIDAGKNFGLLLRSSSIPMGIGVYKGSHIKNNKIIYKPLMYAELITGGETPNFYLENVIEISAGYNHSLAIVKENNETYVVAWGDNRFNDLNAFEGGQIGNGNYTAIQFLSPQYVRTSNTEKLTGATTIDAGCGVSYIQSYNKQTNQNYFSVNGVNTEGQLGTGDNFDRYFATRIDKNLCSPYCGGVSLGIDTSLCIPIQETLQTNLSESSFAFEWFKNNIKLPNTTQSLEITEGGNYSVSITDKTGDCPNKIAAITISEKQKNYTVIHGSFCSNNLTFKVIGNGNFTWFNKQNGFALDTGKYLSTSHFFTEEIIADSIYQVWLQHDGQCQAMPIQTVKNCNCTILPPISIDTVSCYNRPYFVNAIGDSILWHLDSACTEPIILSNAYYPVNLPIGEYSFYATQTKNRCESKGVETHLTLEYCEPWYSISGKAYMANSPIPNSKIYLFDSQLPESIDSCITDSNGNFNLLSQARNTKILAISPNSNFKNTWVGNTFSKENAYEFIVDSHIKGVAVDLLPIFNDITKILTPHFLESIDNIEIYSIQGNKIGMCSPQIEDIIEICSKNIPYIIILKKNNIIQKTFIWTNLN